MLEIKEVKVQIDNFTLLVDLPPIGPGIYALIGPSGGGKSTLLSVLAGFHSLNSGRIFFSERDITEDPAAKRPIAILFQDNNLFPHLSIQRNVALALTTRSKMSSQQEQRVMEVLDRVGLLQHAAKKPSALSGGQQSRAALARVLLQDKPILLLDEPFSALGPAMKQDMLGLVSEISVEKQTIVLMVTHDVSDAKCIASETIFIHAGFVEKPKKTMSLFNNPTEQLASYIGLS